MWNSKEVPYKKSIEDLHTLDKLGRFGLNGSVPKMYTEKNLDQLRPHVELLDDFK